LADYGIKSGESIVSAAVNPPTVEFKIDESGAFYLFSFKVPVACE